MSTLTIKDLPRSEELDRSEMSAIQGGIYRTPHRYWHGK